MPNNLKHLREKRNKSIRDLSVETGINQTAVWKMESGIQPIAENYANILADYFHTTVDYLFGRDNKPVDEKIIYKDRDLTYPMVITKLNEFSSKELLNISGAIDYILEERSKASPNQQLIKNKIDSVIRKDSSN
jgi:transcriptional regulator with XRE-family HTH domain